MARQPSDIEEHRLFGRAVQRLRREAGLTQEQLAARIGISGRYVQEIESGRRGARWGTVVRLLRALDVDLRQLGGAIEKERRAKRSE